MTNSLQWLPDPRDVRLPIPAKTGIEMFSLPDPYAQWVFGRGADFLPSARLVRQDLLDFRYFLHLPTLTARARPLPDAAQGPDAPRPAKGFTGLLPIRSDAVPPTDPRPLPVHDTVAGLDPDKVTIVAIIDDGINIFADRFRPAGCPSRIDYAWIQGAAAPDDSTVPFGRELTRAEITAALDSGLDEDRLLAEFGLNPPLEAPYMPASLNRHESHGTHVADLAGGADPDDRDAETFRLITVQLPTLAVADTSGNGLVAAIQAGAAHVFDRALAMSRAYGAPLPVVLNLSFGLTGGARDGRAFLEQSLRALTDEYRRALTLEFGIAPPAVRVLPAGNQNIAGLHAAGIRADGLLRTGLRLQPEDQTPSYAEFWLPRETEFAIVKISTPDGVAHQVPLPPLPALPEAPTGRAWILAEPAVDGTLTPGTEIARITIDTPKADPAIKPGGDALWWRLVLAFNPTTRRVRKRAAAPPGEWQVTLEARDKNGDPAGRLHGWVLRDERVPQLSDIARQPYFIDTAYIETGFDRYTDIAVDDTRQDGTRVSAVARDGSLSGLASNLGTPGDPLDAVIAGASRWATGAAALYSSAAFHRGEEQGAPDQAPHVLAPGDTSRALAGILASGRLSGTRVAMNGSSIANAVIARALAWQIRDLPPAQYAGYVPVDAAMALGSAPERPPPGEPEIASDPAIRYERLRDGGSTLAAAPGLAPGIERLVHRQ